MRCAKKLPMKVQLEELAKEFDVAILTHKAEGKKVKHPLVYKAYRKKPNGKIDRKPVCMVPATQKGINQMVRTLNGLT